ncbi:MAG: cation diffusion facilitator family transporter [Candidatus Omnitrophota bacterium]
MNQPDRAQSHKKKELRLLKIAFYLTVAYAITGIFVAIVCDSETMMLDALYGAVDVVVSLIAIFVVKKIYDPPNAKYHYGYAKYEPFMTAVDGILIGTICVASIASSLQDLVNRDPVQNISLVVWYSFVSVFICIGFGVYMRRCGRKWGSQILVADSQLWIMEGVISFCIFAAFGVGLIISHTRWAKYTDFVDPVMCIAISLVFIVKPVGILKNSFFDLVDASPDEAMNQRIIAKAKACCLEYPNLTGAGWIKARRAGRRVFVTLHLIAKEGQDIKSLESIREKISEEMLQEEPEMDMCLVFGYQGDLTPKDFLGRLGIPF